jgi:[CysO sulfur-carrier protein]-S-L-cysteine hydrolase
VLRIHASVLAGIADHARREAPRECCGLLVGEDDLVDEYVCTTNIRAGTVAYQIEPAEHFAAIKRARRRGRTIVGAYHSHPRSPAVPSPTDRAEALGEFLYVIVSLTHTPAIRAYRLVDGGFASVEFAAVQ